MSDQTNQTVHFRIQNERTKAGDVLVQVYKAMSEKGYDPVNQIVGYLIRMLERDELLEELVKFYISNHGPLED